MKEPLRSLVVVLLGLGCTVCGLIAEHTRINRDDIILEGGECVYPMSPAFPLGLLAMTLLLLAVSYITTCCACCCRRRRDGVSAPRFRVGMLFAVVSWLWALHAVSAFLVALAANLPGSHGKAPNCYADVEADNHFQSSALAGLFAPLFGVASEKMFHAGTPSGPAPSP